MTIFHVIKYPAPTIAELLKTWPQENLFQFFYSRLPEQLQQKFNDAVEVDIGNWFRPGSIICFGSENFHREDSVFNVCRRLYIRLLTEYEE